MATLAQSSTSLKGIIHGLGHPCAKNCMLALGGGLGIMSGTAPLGVCLVVCVFCLFLFQSFDPHATTGGTAPTLEREAGRAPRRLPTPPGGRGSRLSAPLRPARCSGRISLRCLTLLALLGAGRGAAVHYQSNDSIARHPPGRAVQPWGRPRWTHAGCWWTARFIFLSRQSSFRALKGNLWRATCANVTGDKPDGILDLPGDLIGVQETWASDTFQRRKERPWRTQGCRVAWGPALMPKGDCMKKKGGGVCLISRGAMRRTRLAWPHHVQVTARVVDCLVPLGGGLWLHVINVYGNVHCQAYTEQILVAVAQRFACTGAGPKMLMGDLNIQDVMSSPTLAALVADGWCDAQVTASARMGKPPRPPTVARTPIRATSSVTPLQPWP